MLPNLPHPVVIWDLHIFVCVASKNSFILLPKVASLTEHIENLNRGNSNSLTTVISLMTSQIVYPLHVLSQSAPDTADVL